MMNPENKFSLSSICRFCTSMGGKYTFSNIFKTDKLILKLRQIFKEDIFQADELSHDICSSCLEKVDSCHETITMITSSYYKLNRIQQISKDDENHKLNFEDHGNKTTIVISTDEIKKTMLSTNEENMESNKLTTVENNVYKDKNEVLLIELQLANEESKIQNENYDDNYEMSILNDSQMGENANLTFLCEEDEYFNNLQLNIEPIELLPQNIPDENMTIEEQYYACNMCSFKFDTLAELEMHDKLHKKILPFVCKICGIAIETLKECKQHNRKHSQDEKTKKCSICCRTFDNFWFYKRHMRKEHSGEQTKTKFICSICGNMLANVNTLRVHVRSHNNDCPFTCDICDKGFKRPYLLKVHKATHTRDQKMFGCDMCSKIFHTKSLLKQHLLVHSKTKNHECLICHKFFKRSGNLKMHILKHKENNVNCSPYHFCSGCKSIFKNDLDFNKSIHLIKHSKRDCEPYVCSFCEKQFNKWYSFKNHILKHLGVNLYSCEKCSRNFSTSQTLKQHLILHEDRFPHSCNFCSKSFKRLQSLKVHKMTHTGEKPFECVICKRCFSQKGDLKKHENTHLPKEKRNSKLFNTMFQKNKETIQNNLVIVEQISESSENYQPMKNNTQIGEHVAKEPNIELDNNYLGIQSIVVPNSDCEKVNLLELI